MLALPGPRLIAKPLGLLFNVLGACIGRWVFGFEDSYLDYYDPQYGSAPKRGIPTVARRSDLFLKDSLQDELKD